MIPLLLELYRAGQLKLDELVTIRYTLDEVNQATRDMLDGEHPRLADPRALTAAPGPAAGWRAGR